MQVKAFEADVVEALGYKGSISAADELKGLLDGSKAAGSRKGLAAEQQALFSNLPQVRRLKNSTVYMDVMQGQYAARCLVVCLHASKATNPAVAWHYVGCCVCCSGSMQGNRLSGPCYTRPACLLMLLFCMLWHLCVAAAGAGAGLCC
jgi:hypothetical protein